MNKKIIISYDKEILTNLIKKINNDIDDNKLNDLLNDLNNEYDVIVKRKRGRPSTGIKKEKKELQKRGRKRIYEREEDDKKPKYHQLNQNTIEYRTVKTVCSQCGYDILPVNMARHKKTKNCLRIFNERNNLL